MKTVYGALAVLLVGCGAQMLDAGSEAAGGVSGVADDNASASNATSVAGVSLQALAVPADCYDTTDAVFAAIWPADPASCAATAKGTQSSIVGIWEGYSEDEYFNPLMKYRLELLAASPGAAICGTLKYGDGTPPAPSSDPTAMYPSWGSDYYPRDNIDLRFGSSGLWGLLRGATYTILEGGTIGNQLKFEVSPGEHYKGWCAIQPIYYALGNGYNCAPGNGVRCDVASPDYCEALQYDSAGNEVSLGKFPFAPALLCHTMTIPTCVCDSCRCVASANARYDYELTFNGDEAIGPIPASSAWDMAAVSLRLKRVAP